MGNFFKKMPNGPAISTEPANPPLPPEGGFKTLYKVEGIWGAEGKLRQPDRIVVEMDGGRSTEKPGDTIELTRLEAAVLGQTVMLVPVMGIE